MSTTEEIQSAVSGLSAGDFSRFREWFERFDADFWDKQSEDDAAAGRLDRLANEAIQEFPRWPVHGIVRHFAAAAWGESGDRRRRL